MVTRRVTSLSNLFPCNLHPLLTLVEPLILFDFFLLLKYCLFVYSKRNT